MASTDYTGHSMTLSTPPLADTPLGRTVSQTPTDIWNDSCAIEELQYAVDFGAVGATANPNIVVKFPTTEAGVAAMEEATYRGISVNATVSFSVSQAVAAAEAVERGLDRRAADGLPTDAMGPVV